jgi:hypothetical protein
MPSVMDTIKWKDKWSRMTAGTRNQIITDSIAWLESEERQKCKPDHLSHLLNFQNELQKQLNQSKIPDPWFTFTAQTYSSFPFFSAFIRRAL